MPQPPRDPNTKVVRLVTPAIPPARNGRPRLLKMPPMPQELLDGMTELEREHFDFYIAAYKQDYPGLTPTDELCLINAAFEHINGMRVMAEQLRTGQVITMSRQHPAVQERAWLDLMSTTRKARQAHGSDEGEDKEAWRTALLELSKTPGIRGG